MLKFITLIILIWCIMFLSEPTIFQTIDFWTDFNSSFSASCSWYCKHSIRKKTQLLTTIYQSFFGSSKLLDYCHVCCFLLYDRNFQVSIVIQIMFLSFKCFLFLTGSINMYSFLWFHFIIFLLDSIMLAILVNDIT